MQDALGLALTSRVFLKAYRKAFIPRIGFEYHCRHSNDLIGLQKWVDAGQTLPHGNKDGEADIFMDMDTGDDECGKPEARVEHVRNGKCCHIVDCHFSFFNDPCKEKMELENPLSWLSVG
jgi:hypothetical protein